VSGATQLALSGPLLLAGLLALAAGAVSFASPCCLPLVPGYLAYLTGLAATPIPSDATCAPPSGAGDRPGRRRSGPRRLGERARLVLAAAGFVAGFTVVFTAGILSVLGLSDALALNEQFLERVGGAVTIVMGLAFLGFIPALQRDLRLHRRPGGGLWGAPVLGAVFGLGWTPCLGPTLTGVLALAAGTQIGPATARGLVLVLAYCLGLGLPFVVLALGAGWAVRATDWLRRHTRALQLFGGVLLSLIGLALLTGAWGEFIAWLRGPIGGFGTLL
jgi:cytochrome c-type biogenesis protein